MVNPDKIPYAYWEQIPSLYEASSDKCDIKYDLRNKVSRWRSKLNPYSLLVYSCLRTKPPKELRPWPCKSNSICKQAQHEWSLPHPFHPFVIIHLTLPCPFLYSPAFLTFCFNNCPQSCSLVMESCKQRRLCRQEEGIYLHGPKTTM